MDYSNGGQKRAREEEDGSPMAPESQRRGNPRPAPPLPVDWPAPPLLAPTDDRWIEFLLAAESEFAGKPGYFRDFRAVMRGFRLGAFGVDGLVSHLQQLLKFGK
ncbi:hypothetical protein PVAP13_6KG159354 [Panicum virgatum]|uniref:Uncharacterized protein n=1 Tax=Panicum virgatum TaxID=38727 RepID=A0A8T0R9X8_PANVG|nr:hypothetical protein PVAP13_6KG159354 [Panicum virgatum]